MKKSLGFTLIEVMVVMAVISLFIGISVLAVQNTDNRALDAEAESLATWMQGLSDRSVMEGVVYGLVPNKDDSGFNVATYAALRWYQVANVDGWRSDRFRLEPDDELVDQASQMFVIEESSLALFEDDEAQPQPIVVLFPDGSVLPEGQVQLTTTEDMQQSVEWTSVGEIEVGRLGADEG